MDDRIRLAEAMGIKPKGRYRDIRHQQMVSCGEEEMPPPIYPDPFTDANDDYAVLEWMRGQPADVWRKFMAIIYEGAFCTTLYQIGDYARAALKVIDALNDERNIGQEILDSIKELKEK